MSISRPRAKRGKDSFRVDFSTHAMSSKYRPLSTPAELRRLGVYALPARKGPDSVLHGLQWLQQQEIILAPECGSLREELLNYRWAPDGQDGFLPRPEGEDHLIDALRYAMEGDSNEKRANVMRRFI